MLYLAPFAHVPQRANGEEQRRVGGLMTPRVEAIPAPPVAQTSAQEKARLTCATAKQSRGIGAEEKGSRLGADPNKGTWVGLQAEATMMISAVDDGEALREKAERGELPIVEVFFREMWPVLQVERQRRARLSSPAHAPRSTLLIQARTSDPRTCRPCTLARHGFASTACSPLVVRLRRMWRL